MRAAFRSLLVTLVLLAPMAGRAAEPSYPDCVHPWPCEDDWPDDLDGPFELAEVRYVMIPSHDGTLLEGWIGLPEVPDGVRVPVALHSTPYLGFCPFVPYLEPGCVPTPDDERWWTSPADPEAFLAWRVPPIAMIRRGIAAAFFGVRGTGNSGGCLNEFGIDEQRDQVAIVEWLAAQDWSNGRVAMGGVSYPAATAWEAAIQAPEALKTTITAGIVSDPYTFNFTPQGAAISYTPLFWAMWMSGTSFTPPLGGDLERMTARGLSADRLCPGVAESLATFVADIAADERNAAYYDERRQIHRYADVTAAVLLAQGFDDNAGHAYQESAVWRALGDIPKRMIEGQWGHTFPNAVALDPSWANDSWHEVVLAWLDFWLKGVGPVPEGLGSVDYQDSAGVWRRTSQWPPPEARAEVLYLAGEAITPDAGSGDRSFRSVPVIANEFAGAEFVGFPLDAWPALCEGEAASGAGVGVSFETPPLAESATIGGNPFASLRLSSDQSGGIVGVHLLELPADFTCDAGDPTSVHVVGYGAADLRFWDGTMTAEPFPVGEPTQVRVDLWDNGEVIEAGHRLVAVVSFGEAVPLGWGSAGAPYVPAITVHAGVDPGASHLVLPLVEGTLGGEAPTLTYPPRPFVPAGTG